MIDLTFTPKILHGTLYPHLKNLKLGDNVGVEWGRVVESAMTFTSYGLLSQLCR